MLILAGSFGTSHGASFIEISQARIRLGTRTDLLLNHSERFINMAWKKEYGVV